MSSKLISFLQDSGCDLPLDSVNVNYGHQVYVWQLVMFTEFRKKDILEFSRDEIVSWLADREIAAYRADQILKWIYLRQADGFDVMTDLSKDIRSALSQQFKIGRLDVEQVETSRDGSAKYLFKLHDGKRIESVLIPERDHYTLCVSSQVGCAQDCRFCLTAAGGFERN